MQKIEAKTNEGVIEVKREGPQDKAAIKIKKGKDKNHPKMDVRSYLERIHGTDVLAIYGLSDIGGLELLGETGTDLSKWKTDKRFVGWLNLCPNNKISGGKQISSHVMRQDFKIKKSLLLFYSAHFIYKDIRPLWGRFN